MGANIDEIYNLHIRGIMLNNIRWIMLEYQKKEQVAKLMATCFHIGLNTPS